MLWRDLPLDNRTSCCYWHMAMSVMSRVMSIYNVNSFTHVLHFKDVWAHVASKEPVE